MSGEFNNKKFLFNSLTLRIDAKNNTILKNSTIASYDKSVLSIFNLTIINGSTIESAIIFDSTGNLLENCNIYSNNSCNVRAIYLTQDNNTIKNNTVTVYGPSDEIDWLLDPGLASTLVIAVLSKGNNTLFNNITI